MIRGGHDAGSDDCSTTPPARGPTSSDTVRAVTNSDSFPTPDPDSFPTPDAAPDAAPDPAPDPPPLTARAVDYKGAPLDSERGPGLGCFRFQVVVLAILVVLTPLSVAWTWPAEVSAALLFAVLLLLLLTGQTIIFLLRLVAADRRAESRRRPLASRTKTVGELEDERSSSDRSTDDASPSTSTGEDDPPIA